MISSIRLEAVSLPEILALFCINPPGSIGIFYVSHLESKFKFSNPDFYLMHNLLQLCQQLLMLMNSYLMQ